MICRHCQKRVVSRARSLCWLCSTTPAIRELYPQSDNKYRPRGEPTEAELAVMIAEQRKTMPRS